MPYLTKEYDFRREDLPAYTKKFYQGYLQIENHPVFTHLKGTIYDNRNPLHNKQSSALVHRNGDIYVNIRKEYSPDAWAYILAHALLHLAFGHFDKAKMPFAEYEKIDLPIWNLACDLFITRFLADIKFPGAIFDEPGNEFSVKLNDETKIYSYLKNLSAYDIAALTKGQNFSTHHSLRMLLQTYGTNSPYALDMSGLEHPIVYKDKQTNTYANAFAYALASSVTQTVSSVSGDNRNSPKDTPITKAAQWFLNHYPLLGGIASSF